MSKKQLVKDDPIIKEDINEFSTLLGGGNQPGEKKASKPKKEEMTRFNVYLSVKHLDKLKLKAVREHRKIKELLEEAIIQYLDKE